MLDGIGLSIMPLEPGIFCPELDATRYLDRLSAATIKKLNLRAMSTFGNATKNAKFDVSEQSWETDAWHDVSGTMSTDSALQMLSPLQCSRG